MRSVVVSAPAGTGVGPAVILDQHLAPQDVGIAIEVSAGASLTTKLQWSLDDPYATYATDYNTNAVWFDDKNLTGLTGNTAGTPIDAAGFKIPVRAVRLNNTAYVSGTASLTVVQTGGIS